jgi:hypothetical protein
MTTVVYKSHEFELIDVTAAQTSVTGASHFVLEVELQ